MNEQNRYNQQHGVPYVYQYYKKSRLAAALLAFTVGFLGVHNFYLGYTSKAVIQLVITIVGIFTIIGSFLLPVFAVVIWSFIEGVQIISHSERYIYDGNGIELIE